MPGVLTIPALAQLGAGHNSAARGSVLPAPKTPAQAVGYALGGVVLLAVVFALVMWLKRRDD